MRANLILTSACFAVGCACGALVTRSMSGTRQATVSASSHHETIHRIDELEEALKDLMSQALMERAQPAERIRQPDKVAPSQLVGDWDQLFERLSEAVNHIAQADPLATLPRIAKNESEVGVTLHQYKGDKAGALREHFCMSMREVYRRYGQPDSTTTSGPYVEWRYESMESALVFVFAEGMVDRLKRGPAR